MKRCVDTKYILKKCIYIHFQHIKMKQSGVPISVKTLKVRTEMSDFYHWSLVLQIDHLVYFGYRNTFCKISILYKDKITIFNVLDRILLPETLWGLLISNSQFSCFSLKSCSDYRCALPYLTSIAEFLR